MTWQTSNMSEMPADITTLTFPNLMAQTQAEVLLSEAELRAELQAPQSCVAAGHCQGPVLRIIRGQTLRKAEITVHRRSKPVSKANNSRYFLKFCGPVSNALWSKADCSRPPSRPPWGTTCTSQRCDERGEDQQSTALKPHHEPMRWVSLVSFFTDKGERSERESHLLGHAGICRDQCTRPALRGTHWGCHLQNPQH